MIPTCFPFPITTIPYSVFTGSSFFSAFAIDLLLCPSNSDPYSFLLLGVTWPELFVRAVSQRGGSVVEKCHSASPNKTPKLPPKSKQKGGALLLQTPRWARHSGGVWPQKPGKALQKPSSQKHNRERLQLQGKLAEKTRSRASLWSPGRPL